MKYSQFLRSQTAGFHSFGKKRTLRAWINEGWRKEGFTSHVPHPAEPLVLYGTNEDDTTGILLSAINTHVKNGGRKPDQDAQIFMGTIASFPIPRQTVRQHGILIWVYKQWEKAVIRWARKTHGDQLHKILRHRDEDFYHLHIWSLAKTHGKRFELGPINAGEYAQRGKAPKERKPAYKAAWRTVQNDFWLWVSQTFGFARLSDKPEPRLPYRLAKLKNKINNKNKENDHAYGHSALPIHFPQQGVGDYQTFEQDGDGYTPVPFDAGNHRIRPQGRRTP